MPGPIGQDYEDAATPGSTGSLNAKMRLMTSQLANLTITSVPATGATGVNQMAGPWAVSGSVSLTPTAAPADGAANSALYGVANYGMVLNGASLWDRVRSANAASGTIGTGLRGAGSMVYDGTLWWPAKQAPLNQGAITPAGIPLVAMAFLNGASDYRIVEGNFTDGGNLSAVVPPTLPYLWNGIAHERPRTANAASGTTGVGLAGAGNLIYDPLVTGWYSWRGSALGGGFVQGPAVSGSTAVGNPHVVAGLFTSGAVGGLVMPLVTDATGQLRVAQQGLVSTNNSTTTLLTGSAVFTGTGEDVSAYGSVSVTWIADQVSAANSPSIQFSSDNTNWDVKVAILTSPTANLGFSATCPVVARYFRVVYTNGGVSQGYFRLQTVFHPQTSPFLLPMAGAGASISSQSNFLTSIQPIAFADQNGGVRLSVAQTGADGVGTALLQLQTAAHGYAYNGVSQDRLRIANAASGTTGTGLLGAGTMLYDPLVTGWYSWRGSAAGGGFVQGPAAVGTPASGNPLLLGALDTAGNVQVLRTTLSSTVSAPILATAMQMYNSAGGFVSVGRATDLTDTSSGVNFFGTGPMLWNGTAYERTRTANAASGGIGTGLLGAGSMIYDPLVTGWFSWRGSAAGGGFVQGPAATAAAVAGNPLLAGGKDTAGNVQPVKLGTDGNILPGVVSTANSTTSLLTGSAVFTGTGEDVSGYGSVVVSVFADQPSASTGLSLQFSPDNTNWDNKVGVTIAASTAYSFPWPALAKFFRVVYTNGATNQGAFRLQTIFHPTALPATVPFATLMTGQAINGTLIAGLDGSSNTRAATVLAVNNDGVNPALPALFSASYPVYFDGTSAGNRARNNIITNQFNGTNATSGITNHATQTNFNNTGLIATLNVTAASGTAPTLDIKIQIADGAGTFYDLTDSAGNTVGFQQKATTGTDTLKLAPGLIERLGAVPNRQYAGQLGRTYRFVSTVAGNLMSFSYRLDVSELK